MENIFNTVAFYTLGCKVNQYESQNIREQFLSQGNYKEVSFNEKSDVYVINTCVVTKESEKKARYLIRKIKKDYPFSRVIVTGCLTSGINKNKKIKDADTIISNDDKNNFFEKEHKIISKFKSRTRAFLKIQDGCDSFCSYCIIPYVRDKIYSRPFDEICKEIDNLAENGYKEIVLTGIHIGKYGRNISNNIIDILNYLEEKKEIKRVRLSSFEPKEITDDLIKFIRHSQKVCSHLHIPLQSGDDNILEKMNRNYTCLEYKNIISKIKDSIKHIAVSTDIIVGFPGETKENFENTLKLVEDIKFSKVHIFKYSDRENTKAINFPYKISDIEKKSRFKILKEKTDEIINEYKRSFIGKTVSVLIENVFGGYSDNYLPVKIYNKSFEVNQIINAKVKDVKDGYLLC